MKLQRKSFKLEKKSGGYAYTNTRVRVMKSKLLTHEDMQRFVKMSVAEIARFLQETEYKNEINELALKFRGVNLVEYALNKNIENLFSKVLSFSLKKSKEQVMFYLRKYDVMNIKTILRGKKAGASNEKIMNEIIASGEFSREFLQKVVEESKNVADVIEFFKNTDYHPMLKRYSDNMTKLEDELDKFYYTIVLQSAERHLKNYIMLEIFVKNYLNELRSKRFNVGVDRISNDKVKVKIPFDRESVEARVYGKKLLVTKAIRMVEMFTRDIRPVLGYFVAKENEVNNIRILVRGKESGLEDNTIQQQLVI